MAKRISQEEVIVDFFNTADLGKVETLFNVVKGIIKTRTKDSAPAKIRKPRAPKNVVQSETFTHSHTAN